MFCLMLIFVLFNAILTEKVDDYNKFTKLECSYSGISVNSFYCVILPDGSFFGNATLTMNLTELYGTLRTYFKVDGKYKEVFKYAVKPINICEVLESNKVNPFHRYLKQYWEAKIPIIAHECPFEMGYYPFKLTLDDDKFMRIFPSGDYKKIMTLSNGVDNKIIKIVMDSTLKPQQ